jgi:hypothetical protein
MNHIVDNIKFKKKKKIISAHRMFTIGLVKIVNMKENGEMEVTLNEVRTIFNQLINETVSREYAAEWAQIRQEAEDAGELEYEPQQEENRIWKAIQYLLGVDLKEDPITYLHTVEDFISYYNQMQL